MLLSSFVIIITEQLTLSFTRPFDSSPALYYKWSIVTMSIYLALLCRYGASKIMGSRPWPFGVTWRYRSRDYSTPWSTSSKTLHWFLGFSVLNWETPKPVEIRKTDEQADRRAIRLMRPIKTAARQKASWLVMLPGWRKCR